jgi:hypothetical protein
MILENIRLNLPKNQKRADQFPFNEEKQAKPSWNKGQHFENYIRQNLFDLALAEFLYHHTSSLLSEELQ